MKPCTSNKPAPSLTVVGELDVQKKWPFTPFKTLVIGFAGILLWMLTTILLGWMEVHLGLDPTTSVGPFYLLVLLCTTLLSAFWDPNRWWAALLGGGVPLLLFALQAIIVGKLMVGDDPYTPLLYQFLGYGIALVMVYFLQGGSAKNQ